MSRFDINEHILVACAEYESKCGEKPRYIYLGLAEWQDFKAYCQMAHGIDLRPENNRVIAGCEVLYVPKPSHLGVGG